MDFLTQEKYDFEVINHLKNPLSKSELQELLQKLGRKPSELVRRNEVIFKEANKKGVEEGRRSFQKLCALLLL